ERGEVRPPLRAAGADAVHQQKVRRAAVAMDLDVHHRRRSSSATCVGTKPRHVHFRLSRRARVFAGVARAVRRRRSGLSINSLTQWRFADGRTPAPSPPRDLALPSARGRVIVPKPPPAPHAESGVPPQTHPRKTSMRHTRGDLASRERRYELLVNAITEYAIYMLDPDGIVTSWNAGAQAIEGYTADEIIGEHFTQFYTEEERAAGTPERALAVAAEAGRFEAEGWRVRKDGSRFWAHVIIDPIRGPDGELIGFAKITRDLS